MSRPKPDVLLFFTDKSTYKTDEVLKSDAIFAVFYEGKPINLRTKHAIHDIVSPKYKKVSFSNPGHAFNLATKLNKKFNTDKFEVFKLNIGEKVKSI